MIRSALVLGLGVSGEFSARLLMAQGAAVSVVDQGDEAKQAERAARLRAAGCSVTFGETLPEGAFDLCVASPAFPLAHPWLKACGDRGVCVVSELELGSWFWRGRILAITGSKGKSSLVKLCSDTLSSAGVTASPAGNYGIPLCQLVLEKPDLQWAVVEVSSFQMEHTETLHPDIAVLLNLQADHLDRHSGMEEYKSLKLKLFREMRPGTLALLPEGFDDGGRVPAGCDIRRFGTGAAADWRYADHAVTGRERDAVRRIDLAGGWFDNAILGLAAAAAGAALARAGLSDGQIAAGCAGFQPLKHRMQVVGESETGVLYVDDSKATSLSAMAAALRMAKRPVRLIAGGLLKENDVENVKDLLTQTTKKVYLIGRCAGVLFQAWSETVPCECCGTLERAVDRAVQDARPGETVLLSPGTASFDQFSGYGERGDRFSARVRGVAGLKA